MRDHHCRHHRHRKFHVRPEATGLGYRRFLGVPNSVTYRGAEPGQNSDKSEERNEDTFWWWLVIGATILFAWWDYRIAR